MEKISSTVAALLGLVGLTELDPVRSREHILLSNIFQTAWSQGKDLDLSELILQTQTPPFDKLGVFPLNKFFPEKDRMELAMLLNNFLASPAFQSWMMGTPLDIEQLLYTPEGKPRHSVFYIAHLSDTERMFFVTLLYSSIEAWMRTQTGTTGLRALVYFDEIMGYLPPNRQSIFQNGHFTDAQTSPRFWGWHVTSHPKPGGCGLQGTYPTRAPGLSASCRQIKINNVCWMAWRV